MTTDNTGFEQPNYTQTPNALFDKYLAEIDSMVELKVVLAITRKTLGWRKTRDIISLSQLEKLTGLSRQGVIDGIEKAVKRGLVERKPVGQGFYYRLRMTEPVNDLDQQPSQENRPASQNFGLEPVNDLDQQLVNDLDTQKKGLNKPKETNSSMREIPAMPIKKQDREPTENRKIAAYFAKAINSHEDTLSAMDYRDINRLVDEGFTLDRCKPGIDETVQGIRSRPGGVVRSFRVCEKSIRQLDPLNQPVLIQNYQARPQPKPDQHEAECNSWIEKQYAKMLAQGQISVTA